MEKVILSDEMTAELQALIDMCEDDSPEAEEELKWRTGMNTKEWEEYNKERGL